MFHRVNAHRTFADGCRSLDHFEIVDPGVDRWLVCQILALEFDSVIDRRRVQLERNLLAGVQRHSAETGGFGESLLNFRRGSHDA